MSVIKRCKRHFRYKAWLKKYKMAFPDSFVEPPVFFDLKRIMVGKMSYGHFMVCDPGKKSKVIIGAFVSMANPTFILGAEHFTNHVSTYPFGVMLKTDEGSTEAFSKGDIVIHDDVINHHFN